MATKATKATKATGVSLGIGQLQKLVTVTTFTLPRTKTADGSDVVMFMRPQPARVGIELMEMQESASAAEVMRKVVDVLADTLCDENGNRYATVDELSEVPLALIGEIMESIQSVVQGGVGGKAGNV